MRKNSLQFELILRISIGFILLIIAVSSAIIMFTSNQYNQTIIENIDSNMENMVSSIDYYFEDVKTPMVMMARNGSILEAMKNYKTMSNREKLGTTNAMKDFVQNITTFKSFINDIIIVGNQGFQYNIYNENAGKYLKDFDFDGEDYFQKIQKGDVRLYYVGEHEPRYYIQPPEGERVYSVILPVRNMQNRIGYIICDIEADTINGILDNNLKDNKAKILILGEEGNLICERGNEQISAQVLMAENRNEEEREYQSKNLLKILFTQNNYVTRVKSQVTGWTYLYAEPYENFNGFVKKIFLFNFGVILIGLIVISFFSRQLSRQILTPLKNIAFMIREMKINQGLEQGISHFESQNVNELGIEIEHMIQRMDKLINENYLYELRSRDAQIQMLISQLSPHFLYNTLQLIEYQSLANHQENVIRIINELSYILRYSMNTAKTVKLEEELNYVQAYLDIYQLRYQNKMRYKISAGEQLRQMVMPKMVLEPVVENCIKHGFAGNFNGAFVQVSVEQRERELRIRVRDNGKGISAKKLLQIQEEVQKMEPSKEHIGLKNVNMILRLRYGNEYGVQIESRENEFTEVTLRLLVDLSV